MNKACHLVILIIFCLMPLSLFAQTLSPELEETAKELDTMLIAPCCWIQTLSVHPSGISDEMKTELRNMLAAGRQKQEILDYYVGKHGIRILSIPPQKGFLRLTFLMPILLGIGCFVLAIYLIKTWRRNQEVLKKQQVHQVQPQSAPAKQQNDRLAAQMIKELKELS